MKKKNSRAGQEQQDGVQRCVWEGFDFWYTLLIHIQMCTEEKKWGENKLHNAPQPHTKICKPDKKGRAVDMQRGTTTFSTLGWSVCVSFVEASPSTNRKPFRMLLGTTHPIPWKCQVFFYKTQHSKAAWHMRLQSVPWEIRQQEALSTSRPQKRCLFSAPAQRLEYRWFQLSN